MTPIHYKLLVKLYKRVFRALPPFGLDMDIRLLMFIEKRCSTHSKHEYVWYTSVQLNHTDKVCHLN